MSRRSRVAVLVATLAVGTGSTVAAQDRATTDRSPNPSSWVGERLAYDAKFGFINIGRAELRVAGIDTVREAASLHIQFLIEGGNFLYRLHNEWDSWVGLQDFSSRRFIQDHDEGGRKYRNAYEIYADSGFYRREGVDSVLPTSAQPLDDAAFFYFVRLVDLEPGRRYEFNNYFKPDRNPVVLEVLRRETIDVPAGRFECLVVRPIIKGGGIFKEGAEGQMWISDDERRLVVQIKSKFFFGHLTFRLTDYDPPGSAARDAS